MIAGDSGAGPPCLQCRSHWGVGEYGLCVECELDHELDDPSWTAGERNEEAFWLTEGY